MCGLFWGGHKSLAPRARTLLGGLGQATLSFFAVATLLFVFFGECPKFCDLAKQRRKIVGGVSEVGKDDFSLYFFWRHQRQMSSRSEHYHSSQGSQQDDLKFFCHNLPRYTPFNNALMVVRQ